MCELGLVGYDDCFTRSRSRVRFSELVHVSAISSVVRIHRCQRRGPSSILGWRTHTYINNIFYAHTHTHTHTLIYESTIGAVGSA